MSPPCGYCGGPVTGAGHPGRPWPGRDAGVYCCFGCLSLGEHDCQQAACSALTPDRAKIGGVGVRLGVSAIVVGQSMMFGLALNLHDDVPADVRRLAQTAILAATALVAGLLGGPLFAAAWHALRRGRVTIEALFLLTMGGAVGASLQAYLTGRGPIYFEVVSVLLVVYTLGKVVGARARAAAVSAGRAWAGQLDTCRLADAAGRTRVVPVAEVVPGDVVEVRPGEAVAVDGVVRTGVGFVSEAAVSGEPFAVVRRPGDRVLAGAASHDATFRIEATAAGTARGVDRLLAAVEAARDRPLSLQNRADRLGRWLVPAVALTAAGTFGYWALFTAAGWQTALFNAMSVLLVACPCVVGLATPVVVWSALARLAERGLVVRGGDAVERLAAVDVVAFDKTGTLTDDRFALVDVVTTAAGDERERVLGWLSVVEEQSSHPVARPFARLPRPFPPGEEPRVLEAKVVPGCGLESVLAAADGKRHRVRVGRPEWVGAGDAGELTGQLKDGRGHRVHVEIDGRLAAVAVVAERVRDSAHDAVDRFRRLGLPVEVLTGDTAERAAGLGLPPARGGLLPDDKRARVADLKAAGGRPLMVGDGINDAAALAEAHAGVALASGTDLAVGAADATLYGGDLRVLPWAVEVSRAAVRAVRWNLGRALAYNAAGVALAAAGLLHPVVAALLMVASSLSLLVSSARVGVVPDHCGAAGPSPEPGRFPWRAVVHGVAVALQGVLVLLLLDDARGPVAAAVVLGGFAAAGAGLGAWWQRRPGLSHAVDMAFGMLTAGNLGMLLGWWADAGFAPLFCPHCCSCGDLPAKPWMWVGMFLFANAAMVWLGRRPLPRGLHRLAMFTGGNVGMGAGMLLGGMAAASAGVESVPAAFTLHALGMTAGMVLGMQAGTWAAERAFAAAGGRSTRAPEFP